MIGMNPVTSKIIEIDPDRISASRDESRYNSFTTIYPGSEPIKSRKPVLDRGNFLGVVTG